MSTKSRLCILIAIAAVGWWTVQAQSPPGAPEHSGLQPRSETVYINNMDTINNLKTESLGVAIALTGDVLVGWEDDGTGLQNFGAVWTMLDPAVQSITPMTRITSLQPQYAGQELNINFLSYFRADGSATPGFTSWGPKIKANLFGHSLGMGATSYGLGLEVPELIGFHDAANADYPTVQLLTDSGAPVAIVAGVTDAYAQAPDSIRIADWGYLSNGNVVIVSESRQQADLVNLYGGASPANHIIFRIVDQSGNEVKPVTLATEQPVAAAMWHGVGITQNGFAIRFEKAGRTTIRMFDNDGNAITGDLDLGTLTGFEVAAGGGRGDNAGFQGNGWDAYVAVNSGTHQGQNVVWVTVLNDDGTVRWSKSAVTDMTLTAQLGAPDAAIERNGEVIVVFSDVVMGNPLPFVMGCRLDPDGNLIGDTFFVSELEDPHMFPGGVLRAVKPRIALRDGLVAIVWQSDNDSFSRPFDYTCVAIRLFAAYEPGDLESAGLTRLVDDTPITVPDIDMRWVWDPYASVLGTSTFLISGNTWAEGSSEHMRYVVALQPAAGGPMKLAEGFFADNGQPYRGQINLSRQTGNPGRVAGDKRPGAINMMVGGEASPHGLPQVFGSDNRWNLGFDRLGNGRYGTIQLFEIDPVTLSQTMLCKAQDSALGRMTTGVAPGPEISRFGGELACLDNGNFLSVVEDRSRLFNPDGHAVVATIFAPDGSIVKDSWKVANGDIWSNVAAYRGGFAVRATPTEGGGRAIYFFDNEGNYQGEAHQDTSGISFDAGRGDGTRIGAHINSPYVYLTGREVGGTDVKVAVWDSRDASFVVAANVNEAGFATDADPADPVNLAVDALNRFTVSWVVRLEGYEQGQVVARVLKLDPAAPQISPLTPSFLPFINNARTGGIRTVSMTVAMTTKEICIAAKGNINMQNNPSEGANSVNDINFFTVFTHPAPADDPTPSVHGDPPTLAIALDSNQVTISWAPETPGFVLEMTDSLSAPDWIAAPTGNPVTVDAAGSAMFYRLAMP